MGTSVRRQTTVALTTLHGVSATVVDTLHGRKPRARPVEAGDVIQRFSPSGNPSSWEAWEGPFSEVAGVRRWDPPVVPGCPPHAVHRGHPPKSSRGPGTVAPAVSERPLRCPGALSDETASWRRPAALRTTAFAERIPPRPCLGGRGRLVTTICVLSAALTNTLDIPVVGVDKIRKSGENRFHRGR